MTATAGTQRAFMLGGANTDTLTGGIGCHEADAYHLWRRAA